MKILISSVIGFLSSVAIAFPTQGDYVKFDLLETPANSTTLVTGTLEQELTAVDTATNLYTQTDTTTVGNSGPTIDVSSGTVADLISTEKITEVLQNCAGYNGIPSSVTVGTQEYPACAVPSSNPDQAGTYWIGMVPFGILHADLLLADGTHVTVSLDSFHEGKK